jgi:SAM-dependent methyltransferase
MGYYDYQLRVAREVIIPWVGSRLALAGASVADFGAHGGGTLEAFREAGVGSGVGIELNEALVRTSRFVPDERFKLEVADLTTLDGSAGRFDLVVLHDVLEHVVDIGAVLRAARRSLTPEGRVFVSFPPYWSAYGGHQHLAAGPARFVPFIHLLPSRAFFRLARPADNEYMSSGDSLDDMVSVRRTRLSVGRAERAFAREGLGVANRELYLLRPEYTVRYGVRAIPLRRAGRVPVLREAIPTGAFYLLAAEG